MSTVNTGMLRKVLRNMDMDTTTYVELTTSLLEGNEVCLEEIPESETCIKWLEVDLDFTAPSVEDYKLKLLEGIDEVIGTANIDKHKITSIEGDYRESELGVRYLIPASDYTKTNIIDYNIKVTKVLDNFDKIKELYLSELKKYSYHSKIKIHQQIKELQQQLEEL